MTLRKTTIIKSAVALTLISFAVKALGMLFRVYLSARIGTEGMGLYQLTMSVYSLFATFATSGFTVAVSRLAAERYENPDVNTGKADARRILHISLIISLLFGLISTVLLFLLAGQLSVTVLQDARTRLPLKILSASMIFMAMSACVKGYFIAARQIYKPSLTSLFEQLVKICVTVAFFTFFLKDTADVGKLCSGLVAGLTVGEISSYLLLVVLYFFCGERKTRSLPSESTKSSLSSLLGVIMPIAGSAYVISALHTVESILIPLQFAKHGGSTADALSAFGIIRGMVIPVLFFPFGFLSSLVSIMIPEISRLNTLEDKSKRNARISRTMSLTFIFSIAAGGVFYFFSREISVTVYKTEEAADAIRLLSLVTPFMYIETISDGLLKAIGEQLSTFRYCIYNSVLRITVILFLIPKTGVSGYIWLLIASNTFSFALCVCRLKKTTGFSLNFFRETLLPFVIAALSGIAAKKFVYAMDIPYLWATTALGAVIYLALYSGAVFFGRGKKMG